MKVFVAGASGVIGRVLVPRLLEAGHQVTGMTRSAERAQLLEAQGAEAVVCDVYDAEALERAVGNAQPDVLVHQLTALPPALDPRKIGEQLAANDRIRVEGTRNLMLAAQAVGVSRVVAQSVAFAYAPEGGWVKEEGDPLWLAAPDPWRRSVDALVSLERSVLGGASEGVVLRYGFFYGPGAAYAADGSIAALVHKRGVPIVGKGTGLFSFVHVDDAADATVLAIERGAPGVYNIADDDPALVREWLPIYAAALGAPKPLRVPVLAARALAGRYGVYVMTEQRGASNARVKAELGWAPKERSWREGLPASLG